MDLKGKRLGIGRIRREIYNCIGVKVCGTKCSMFILVENCVSHSYSVLNPKAMYVIAMS